SPPREPGVRRAEEVKRPDVWETLLRDPLRLRQERPSLLDDPRQRRPDSARSVDLQRQGLRIRLDERALSVRETSDLRGQPYEVWSERIGERVPRREATSRQLSPNVSGDESRADPLPGIQRAGARDRERFREPLHEAVVVAKEALRVG